MTNTKRKILIFILLPILLSSFLSVGYSQADITSDLVLYLPFNEGSGTTAIDYSGTNSHAIITNAVYGTGKFSYALLMDGTADYAISTLYGAGAGNLSAATLSFWVNITSYTGTAWSLVFREDYNSQGNFGFSGFGSTIYSAEYYETAGWKGALPYTGFSNNTWVHLSLVFNGTGSTSYVNGVYFASQVFASDILGVADTFYIGAGATATFSGLIDDVRLYSRALSASEISDLYNYNPSATPTPTPEPSYTPFPEGDMSNTDWWISILVVMLIIINIFLMMLPFALVRFVFGILSLFLCMLALSYQVPLSPYLQTAGLLISALAMLFSVRARE